MASAAGVTGDVAPGDDWKQTVAVRLKLQQATLAMEVRALAAEFLSEPVVICVEINQCVGCSR